MRILITTVSGTKERGGVLGKCFTALVMNTKVILTPTLTQSNTNVTLLFQQVPSLPFFYASKFSVLNANLMDHKGEWYRNLKAGHGVMLWKDREEEYVGRWKAGYPHGEGVYTWRFPCT